MGDHAEALFSSLPGAKETGSINYLELIRRAREQREEGDAAIQGF